MQFFRLYVGVYVYALPEMIASTQPTSWLRGSRAHVTPQCRTVAVAFESARFTAVPPGVPNATYVFDNSTVWYSSQAQVRSHVCTRMIVAAC